VTHTHAPFDRFEAVGVKDCSFGTEPALPLLSDRPPGFRLHSPSRNASRTVRLVGPLTDDALEPCWRSQSALDTAKIEQMSVSRAR